MPSQRLNQFTRVVFSAGMMACAGLIGARPESAAAGDGGGAPTVVPIMPTFGASAAASFRTRRLSDAALQRLSQGLPGENDGQPRGACDETVYQSSDFGPFFFSANDGLDFELIFLDDIELDGSARGLCRITFILASTEETPLPYLVNCNLYEDCVPDIDGIPRPGPQFNSRNALVEHHGVVAVHFDFDGETLPDTRPGPLTSCDGTLDFWVGVHVAGPANTTAGPICRPQGCEFVVPEIGCSDDVAGQDSEPPNEPSNSCTKDFGGCQNLDPFGEFNPPATLLMTIRANDDVSECFPGCCRGDMDGNGLPDAMDIPLFVETFVNNTTCDQEAFCKADLDGDFVLTNGDISLFIVRLLNDISCF